MVNISIDLSELQKKFDAVEKAIIEGANIGLNHALTGVENSVKNRIQISGTYGSANRFAGRYGQFAGPGQSGIGRIDTGLMFNSIERSVTSDGKNISGEVKWPDNRPKYFDWQESGFDYKTNRYPISGPPHHVEGMFAWRDAQTLLNKTGKGLVTSWVKNYLGKVT